MPKINEIDEKDRKILTELDKNARQTDSDIAKKVGLSKQVVNYRIQKLLERGIVRNFYSVLNAGKLGFNSYYVFLQLQKTSNQEEKELLSRLKNLDYVGWLVSGIGRWDIILLLYANSILNFDRLLSNIMEICGSHLHEYNFTALISSEHISYKFLAETRSFQGIKQIEEKTEIPKLDKADISILRAISQNSRASIIELSKNINETIQITRYHLKNLISQKIIEGFKPQIDAKKLGYQWNLLLLQFSSVGEKRKNEFINFCKEHKKIYYVTNTIGLYNLMLDVYVRSNEEFKEVLLGLKEKYSDVIKSYESFIVFDEHKINYFPGALEIKSNIFK